MPLDRMKHHILDIVILVQLTKGNDFFFCTKEHQHISHKNKISNSRKRTMNSDNNFNHMDFPSTKLENLFHFLFCRM